MSELNDTAWDCLVMKIILCYDMIFDTLDKPMFDLIRMNHLDIEIRYILIKRENARMIIQRKIIIA